MIRWNDSLWSLLQIHLYSVVLYLEWFNIKKCLKAKFLLLCLQEPLFVKLWQQFQHHMRQNRSFKDVCVKNKNIRHNSTQSQIFKMRHDCIKCNWKVKMSHRLHSTIRMHSLQTFTTSGVIQACSSAAWVVITRYVPWKERGNQNQTLLQVSVVQGHHLQFDPKQTNLCTQALHTLCNDV